MTAMKAGNSRGFQQILKEAEVFHNPLRLQLAPFELRGTQEHKKHVYHSKLSPNTKTRIMTILHEFRDEARAEELACPSSIFSEAVSRCAQERTVHVVAKNYSLP